MRHDLLIFPFSGTGKEALDCIGDEYNCIGFISDDVQVIGTEYNGFQIYSREAFNHFKVSKVLAVPGSPSNFHKRKAVIQGLQIEEERFAKVIHPNAWVSKTAIIGNNALVMAHVNIGPDAVIGNNVCILPNSTIHHDSRIKDYTLIGGNVLIAGNVVIGENCYIGAGSNIINGCTVGEKTLVGLGSNVIRDVKPLFKVAGNPAMPIGKYE